MTIKPHKEEISILSIYADIKLEKNSKMSGVQDKCTSVISDS